jgi:hypothetical protein
MGFFSKLKKNANHFFKKAGGDLSTIGQKLSTGASGVLGGIGNVAGVLAKNSIVNQLTGGEGNALLGQISDVAKQAGNTVNYKNYSGGVNQVSNQLQKNIQGIQNSAGGAGIFVG